MGSLNQNSFVENAPTTYFVSLNSAVARQPAGSFYVPFTRPLDLSHGNWSVAMTDLAVWNTSYNVDAAYRNLTFDIYTSYPTGKTTLTLTAGVYNAPALIQAITNLITGVSAAAGAGIVLSINTSQITFNLTITNTGGTFAFDPSAGGTSNLFINLGAANTTVYTASTIFPNQANISNGVSNYQVRTNVVGSSYANGQASTVLYNFVPAVAPGALYYVAPAFPIFSQVNQQSISGVQIQITDSNGNVIDLNSGAQGQNNPTNVSLLFRKN